MWIKELKLHNVQSYEKAFLHFSKGINVLIGSNNSGKSTIIKSLYRLQASHIVNNSSIRKGEDYGEIQVVLSDSNDGYLKHINEHGVTILPAVKDNRVLIRISDTSPNSFYFDNNLTRWATLPARDGFTLKNESNNTLRYLEFKPFEHIEPNNFIYPFLAKRRKSSYDERLSLDQSGNVSSDLSNLASKIQKLTNPSHPENKNYIKACDDILGFAVGLIPSSNGSGIGIFASNSAPIPIESMGDGVANIIGLLSILHNDKNKLFLIEELENDIHPAALKKLLSLIIEKSGTNQIIVSTHSNIVAKYLGSAPDSKLFQTSCSLINSIPTSEVKEIENTPEAKRSVLEDLGYELYDYNLWEAYLILEESSAEVIIKEFLIPWFTPRLNGRLRTISANGLTKVTPVFEDFQRLFLFTHLEPSYKNRTWVVVDEGAESDLIIEKLKNAFCKSGWEEQTFRKFNKHDFEEYYPSVFQQKIDNILTTKGNDKKAIKRELKKQLVNEVKEWARSNEILAKEEFRKSASEVIDLLLEIESKILKKN